MLRFNYKKLSMAAFTLTVTSNAWSLPPEFDKWYIDITAPQDAKKVVSDTAVNKLIKEDPSAFLASYVVTFSTQAEYKVQKATQSVAITGWTKLLGVPDEVFQEIVDESAAYAEKKWGEVLGSVVVEADLAKHDKWASIESKIEANELKIETKRKAIDTAAAAGTHYKKFARGGVPPKALTNVKGGMALWKIQMKEKFTTVNINYGVSFSVVGDGSGFSHGKDTVTAALAVEPLLTGSGGTLLSNNKMKTGGTGVSKVSTIIDNSWVKSVVKKDGPVWEIEADPVMFKEASLKLLKGMIDLETERAKAIKAGG